MVMTKAELFWLTLTTVLTGLVWVPYILDRMAVRGLMGTLVNKRSTTAIATVVVAVIVSLNVFLLYLLVAGR